MEHHSFARSMGIGAFVALMGACSSSAQQARNLAPADVVATVGGTSITLEQVDEKALQQPAGSFGSLKLSQALYEARRAAADEIIGNLLLDQEAKRLGVDRAKLIQQEIAAHVTPVTEADVSAWYGANTQRVQGATIDQVRAPITQLLQQERSQSARDTYLDTLKVKTPVQIMLEPPRQTVSAGKSPARGTANAPIELIEFADFQCPFCGRFFSTTGKEIIEKYVKTGKAKLVYHDFAFLGEESNWAAEASRCAGDQNKYWQYHDYLYTHQKGENEGAFTKDHLKSFALEIGLNKGDFNNCLDSGKYAKDVANDTEAGRKLGVTGTPTSFVNGKIVQGAVPLAQFESAILEALKQK